MKKAKAMGKRRMIFGSISTSKKFNCLKTDQARLLYLMMYPHSDDFGRMEADPSAIKMMAVPGLDWSFANIQEYLDDLSTSNLIEFYEIDGTIYFEFIAFDDHQVFQRQRVGKYPEPIQQLNSSKTELNSLKISKVKISKVKEPSEAEVDEIYKLYPYKSNGRERIAKSLDDKVKIAQILKTEYPLKLAVEVAASLDYPKDLATFLNHLPDPDTLEKPFVDMGYNHENLPKGY